MSSCRHFSSSRALRISVEIVLLFVSVLRASVNSSAGSVPNSASSSTQTTMWLINIGLKCEYFSPNLLKPSGIF